ncbi:MAG: hypothetical protein FJ363_03405 [Gemmatimonadetes bacterium]|nr:hypothetical protein [Gemmatimonadota bacterium]
MTKSARSVLVFGWYLVGLGVMLVALPNVILGMFFLPLTNEVWLRVVGMLVLCLAYYYINAARAGLRPMLEWTVHVRATVIVWFAAFVVLGFAEWPLILFGVVDVAGALWTRAALRAEARG